MLLNNRVYESYSATRSGGTGEPNYTEVNKKINNNSFLFGSDNINKSCIIKNTACKSTKHMNTNKLSVLTKENIKLKSDYGKLKAEMEKIERTLEDAKLKIHEDSIKVKHLETIIVQKDQSIQKIKEEFQEERETENKIIAEYINAENYLLELVDEFTHGMRKIYANDIEFKDVDVEGIPFWERFSNLLYNILLIIDFQKQFIVEQSKNSNQINHNLYDNQSIIEEAENEEETEHDANTHKNQVDDNESGDEVIMRSHEHELLQNPHSINENKRRSVYSNSKHCHNDEIITFEGKYENEKTYDSKVSSQLFSDEDIRNSQDHGLFISNEPLKEHISNSSSLNLQSKEISKSPLSPSELKINGSPKISLLLERSNKNNSIKNEESWEKFKNENIRTSNHEKMHTFNPFNNSLPNSSSENCNSISKDLLSKLLKIMYSLENIKFYLNYII